MMFVLAIVVVLVLVCAGVVASGRWGQMPPVVDDRPSRLPSGDGPVTAADLRATRFSVVPRGYSMEQVDALVARLASQLEDGQASGVEPDEDHVEVRPARPYVELDD